MKRTAHRANGLPTTMVATAAKPTSILVPMPMPKYTASELTPKSTNSRSTAMLTAARTTR